MRPLDLFEVSLEMLPRVQYVVLLNLNKKLSVDFYNYFLFQNSRFCFSLVNLTKQSFGTMLVYVVIIFQFQMTERIQL